MPDFHHGVTVNETPTNQQAIRSVSPSVIGLVATADDADAAYFPLNQPVLVTKISEAQGKAGTKGTLSRVLRDIAEQVKPVLVIVRVPEGSNTLAALPPDATEQQKTEAKAADEADQLAKTIGANVDGAYTGIYALLTGESTGAKPKILGAPYLDQSAAAQVLVAVAKKLHAMAYFELHAAGITAALAAADAYGDREAMPIYGRWTRFDTITKAITEISPVGAALGLRAQIDAQQGWHKSLSNITVSGVSGIARPVHFDIQATGTDADQLNEAGVTCLINRQGFRFWGNRTRSDEAQFVFEPYTRTAQVLRESVANAFLPYIDKPLVPGLARDILEALNAFGRDLVARGQLLGFRAWYDEDLNETDQLKQGVLTICYEYTPVPPLEHLMLRQSFTDRYLADFANRVASANANA